MDGSLGSAFCRTTIWAPKNDVWTRRTDRGQLEKFSKTLLAFRTPFAHEEIQEGDSLEPEALNLCRHVPSYCASCQDMICLLSPQKPRPHLLSQSQMVRVVLGSN